MESRQHRFCAACCPARRSSASRRSTKSSVGPFSQTPPSIWSYPSTRDSRSWQRRSTHCCPPSTLFESAAWRGGDAQLLLRLMRENNFPQIWVPGPENGGSLVLDVAEWMCVFAVVGVRFVRGTARYRTWCEVDA